MKAPDKLYLDPETWQLVSKYDENAIIYVRQDLPIYNRNFRMPRAVVGINEKGEEKEWPSVAACNKELITTSVTACIKAKCLCKGWALTYKDKFNE